MKKVILLLLFIPELLCGQVNETFESATLSRWSQGITGHWKADTAGSLAGQYSLHHVFDNPESGNDQAGIPLTGLEPTMGSTSWIFKLKHGYDPSSSNNWGVFLLSDSEPAAMIPGGAVSGFVIGVNLTGYDDTLRLWKVRNGSLSVVLSTGINWQSEIGTGSYANLSIERTVDGRWKSRVDSEAGILIDTASKVDNELFDAEWFGIYYEYSSTRDRLLWIDDIIVDGVFIEDKKPPSILKCITGSPSSVELTLDEEPETEFFTASNFSLGDKSETPFAVFKVSPFIIRIIFEHNFMNKYENNIIIKFLCDKSGNCARDVNISFTPVWPEPGDVIISEIMADPFPAVSLPGKEYLEIYNKSKFSFNLKNWKLITDGQASVFPETIIKPGEQMILCQVQDTSLFSGYGRVTGLRSFPALTDGGRLLIITDSSSRMIHGVRYSSGWYSDNLKKEGGWSLEMTDTDYPFFSEGNWEASISGNGGTPGRTNSVSRSNRDISFRGILNAFPVDSNDLKIIFSEPVKNLTGNTAGIRINGSLVETVISLDLLMSEYIIKPVIPFKENCEYKLTITSDITDFAGNSPDVSSYAFGLTEKAIKGDMVFNEILFNPFPGCEDFVELFNSSDKIIDASELYFVSVSESGTYSSPVSISDDNRCILPGSYFTVSTGIESLLERYISSREENIFQISQLPSMPDDKGHLILLNRQLETLDEIIYNEKMHYSLLSGYEGISLEKVRPSVISSDPKNWHSASEASGWATPGAPNSVYSAEPLGEESVILSSTRITPDNNGYEDLLVIDMNFRTNGTVVTITIFDETGGYVCKPADNLLAGNRASVTWDATADDGSIVRSGIYIILVSAYDDSGKTEKWKRVCAVIR
jgi:hypothetical protein